MIKYDKMGIIYWCKMFTIFTITFPLGNVFKNNYLVYRKIYHKTSQIVKLLQHKYAQILKIVIFTKQILVNIQL